MASPPSYALARLGEYELVRRIATGGMSEVYEARRPGPRGFAKRVALKRILPQLATDDRSVRMFCAEARVHAALSHPNLVSVLDFGEAQGELYLVMEYVDGVSLSEVMCALVSRRRSMELGPALHIVREVAAGLSYAHEFRDEDDAPLGLVHRDVAPNNILLGRAGEVKLTDFGIVQSTWCDVRTAPGELRGKVGYVSPEQALGQRADARSDLFSLGVVLAELLLGAPLIPGESDAEILRNLQLGRFGNLSALTLRLPRDVLRLVERLLQRWPKDRPASARSLVAEVDALANGLGLRQSAHGLSAWLADLGVIRLESDVRARAVASASHVSIPQPGNFSGAGTSERHAAATIVEIDALEPIRVVASRHPGPEEAPTLKARSAQSGNLRYRLRRPNGEILGPLSLASVLSMVATGRAGLDSLLAREEGPFLVLSQAFELTRLAARPLYRFTDPVALLASERHPLDRGSLAALLLRWCIARRTGLLVHRRGVEQRRIYLEHGVPAASASSDPDDLLGAMLVSGGQLERADLERVLESGYRSGCQLGESLVRAKLLTEPALEAALAAQRLRRLSALCRSRSGELFLVDDARSGEASIGLAAKPISLVVEALRLAYAGSELLQMLAGFETTVLKPAASCAAIRAALGLSADEAYAFDLCVRGVKVGLVLREAGARGSGALRAAAFAAFIGLSAGAFVRRPPGG